MVLSASDPWQALDEELARWPVTPTLWLRDDDAVAPAAALSTLLQLCAANDVPVCAAVIPAAMAPGFAAWLDEHEAAIAVVAHGFAHINHAPPAEKKAEFGDHRAAEIIAAELRMSLSRLVDAFGSASRPVFVPPWNRLGPTAGAALAGAGFRALSAKSQAAHLPVTGVTVIDVDIDIIDWRGTRGYGGDESVVGALCGRLRTLRQQGRTNAPTGILTHHAVHDPAAWTFLETLFNRATAKARWLSVDDVMAAVR
ncbi:MAG: polysaccharide deacetylase [Proteobacteria bacterium]|nr:polysaccharide deacetylase [Pseudomonadota bacterium]MDA1057880.1 polysaccharide deacetylase [Pseudomonadota bacterium]